MAAAVPTLKPGAKEEIDALLRATVETETVPAVFFGATNAVETIYWNQAGNVVFGNPDAGQVDENTTTELFSQTKFVTCIAALQLVDRGTVSLDSVEDVERYLPEIGKIPLLKGYDDDEIPILVAPTKKITLRMLMSHSAGFIYPHTESVLSQWVAKYAGPGMFDPKGTIESALCTPLIYEPGTSWQYSHSIDWVGVLVERVSGLTLEDYFKRHIFEPAGITSLTFYPTAEIKAKKMSVCVRDAEGKVVTTPDGFGMGRPTEVDQVALLLGGAGLFGTQLDYLKLLRTVLQCDPRHRSLSALSTQSEPLLSPESFAELFRPSVPVGAGYNGTEMMSEMVSRPAYFDPPATPQNVNHSVGFLINLEQFNGRRSASSGCWSGAAKTQFWIDPTKGVAGVCGTQLLSASPDPWFSTYTEYERLIYKGLQ